MHEQSKAPAELATLFFTVGPRSLPSQVKYVLFVKDECKYLNKLCMPQAIQNAYEPLPPEQQVDGKTLLVLGTSGNVDQFVACGLKTVKDQLKLRSLLGQLQSHDLLSRGPA